MVELNLPYDLDISEFFSNYVAEHFNSSVAGKDTSALAGKEFKLQYEVGEQKYGVMITNGDKLEIVDGGFDSPTLCLHMEEPDWRNHISGRVDAGLDRFIDPTQLLDPKRYAKLMNTKGTLILKLKNDDGEQAVARIIFQDAAKPSATLKLKLSDWVGMQKGKKSGPMLFMSGKIKAGGDMGLVMKAQSLMS